MIGVQVFGKGKIYKPTWTQNHPWAYGPRMVLCPALELVFFETWTHLRPGKPSSNFKFAQSYTVIIWNLYLSFPNYIYVWHKWVYVSK